MTTISVGDMARLFNGTRQSAMLKERLDTLAQELSTGRTADLARHLGGDQRRAADLERRIALADSHVLANRETAGLLSGMQLALTSAEDTRSRVATSILSLGPSILPDQVATTADTARAAFGTLVAALNTRIGDTSLFAGAATDRNALAPAETMLAAIETAVTGALTIDDVMTALDTWFDTPGGGFETVGYLGDTGAPLSRALDVGESLAMPVRADSQEIRDLLKGTALAALAGHAPLGFDNLARGQMLRAAGEQVLSANHDIATMQGRIGAAEQRTDEATARHAGHKSAWSIMLSEMVSADPYETATALTSAESQLELHFTLTARLSGLSLARYLR